MEAKIQSLTVAGWARSSVAIPGPNLGYSVPIASKTQSSTTHARKTVSRGGRICGNTSSEYTCDRYTAMFAGSYSGET